MPRQPRQNPRRRAGPEPFGAPLSALVTAIVAGICIAIVLAAGVLIQVFTVPRPSGTFADCRTSARLAPGLYAAPPRMCIDPHREVDATIQTTQGNLGLVLQTKQAPRTVNNFVVLALNGYYDGQRFFGAQSWEISAGDPKGPGYSLPAAPIPKGESWQPGSLGMARLPDGRVSGSEFFITRSGWQGGNPTVPYNHFATVTTGFDNVAKLSGSDRILQITIKSG